MLLEDKSKNVGREQPNVEYSLLINDFNLKIKEPTRVFGRADFAGFTINDEYQYFARRHFTITYDKGNFFIRNGAKVPSQSNNWSENANATKLNGMEIQGLGKHRLENHDKILLADTLEMQFLWRRLN